MKSISQKAACSQIPASEESGPLPIGELGNAPIDLRPTCQFDDCGVHGDRTPLSELPPVDWSNITKDPRLIDLEAFEMHQNDCACGGCVRTTLRMSNRPELASDVP